MQKVMREFVGDWPGPALIVSMDQAMPLLNGPLLYDAATATSFAYPVPQCLLSPAYISYPTRPHWSQRHLFDVLLGKLAQAGIFTKLDSDMWVKFRALGLVHRGPALSTSSSSVPTPEEPRPIKLSALHEPAAVLCVELRLPRSAVSPGGGPIVQRVPGREHESPMAQAQQPDGLPLPAQAQRHVPHNEAAAVAGAPEHPAGLQLDPIRDEKAMQEGLLELVREPPGPAFIVSLDQARPLLHGPILWDAATGASFAHPVPQCLLSPAYVSYPTRPRWPQQRVLDALLGIAAQAGIFTKLDSDRGLPRGKGAAHVCYTDNGEKGVAAQPPAAPIRWAVNAY
ncbi:Protein of unknown function [Gryllus bimaculatus]|nr:Protein of unknown function [Gryllus bimaculatus]